MRKWIFISVITLTVPIVSVAQDDMYFVPKKADKVKSTYENVLPRETFYSGSDRNVDEYNRRGTYVTEIDSAGNDVIDFDGVSGVYPESAPVYDEDDYAYTRRMSRFDDYAWSDPYWAGYYAGRYAGRWYDPWYYGGWYYDPWYYGWYDPWYYGYHGWHGYWWGHPHYVVSYNPRPAGTFKHITGTGRRPLAGYGSTNSAGNGFSNRGTGRIGSVRNKTFSASDRFGTNRNTNTGNRTFNNNNRNNTQRNDINTTTTTRPSSSFGSGNGFGGSRSGGSFGGGSRSSGGGGSRFGGRR